MSIMFTGTWTDDDREKVEQFFAKIHATATWRVHAAQAGTFMAHPWGWKGCLCAASLDVLLRGIEKVEEAAATVWRTLTQKEPLDEELSWSWY